MRRREDLTTPRGRRRVGIHYDPEAFGQFSEAIARTIGTARFLVWQSVIVALWLALNAVDGVAQFDPPPFIGLTLVLSLQAAYAAPLILLAQNRQEDRDRASAASDRLLNARTQADTEFLAREVASIRLALSDMVTATELSDQLEHLTDMLARIERRLDEPGSGGQADERA